MSNERKPERKSLENRATSASLIISLGINLALALLTYFLFRITSGYPGHLIYFIFGMGVVSALLIAALVRFSFFHYLSFSLRRIKNADHTFREDGTPFKARYGDADSENAISMLYSNFDEQSNSVYMLMDDFKHLADNIHSNYYFPGQPHTKI